AAHYRSIVTNEIVWTNPMTLALIKGDERTFVERAVAANPAPSAEEIARVDAIMKPFKPYTDVFQFLRKPSLVLMTIAITLCLYVGIPALLAALIWRGGLVLLAAGVAYVRH